MNNYNSMKLEMLALKWAVTEKCRDYLLGGTFVVYTNNSPLSYINTSAKLGATEMRWVSQLAQFNFEIKYSSGRTNSNLDTLSRTPVHKDLQTNVNHIAHSTPLFEFSQGSKYVERELFFNQINVEQPVVCTPTFPEYSSIELKYLQTCDKTLSIVANFVAETEKNHHRKNCQVNQKKSERVYRNLNHYASSMMFCTEQLMIQKSVNVTSY